MQWASWLEIHAPMYTPAQRTSMSCLMDFLELEDVSDLSALDEHALTYASLHKPQRGQQGHFGLMDICRFRHVMELCNYPYFNITPNAPTTTQTYSHDIPFVSGTATTPPSIVVDKFTIHS
jgi:hypothetical protein